MRLIDADTLLKLCNDCEGFHVPVEITIQNIKNMPTVVESVKHVHWIDDGDFDMTNCPNCGAPINGDVCRYCGTNLSRLRNKR